VTIRQMLLVGSSTVATGISYQGYATANTTSVSLPTHIADDVLLMLAINYSSTIPSLPAGWTNIDSGPTLGAMRGRLAYKVAASGSEVSGTWTSAQQLICGCYRGVSAIGAKGSYPYSGYLDVVFKSVSLQVTNGSSWVVGAAGIQGCTSGYTNAPTGMTHRGVGSSSSNRIVLNDTAGGVSSWSDKTVSTDASLCLAFTVELKG